MALTLAELAEYSRQGFIPGAGDTLTTLIVAGIAIHEIIGPVLLKVALGLSNEIPGPEDNDNDDAPPANQETFTSDGSPDDTEQTEIVELAKTINQTLSSQSEQLNELAADWSSDLKSCENSQTMRLRRVSKFTGTLQRNSA